ncbi:MAG: arylsulfatase A [Cyclobacteriaceae bacterium]|jgi:arylsulfatase A-like enzyme
MKLIVVVFAMLFISAGTTNQNNDSERVVATKQPNILYIMIDDLGWMDLHCQGNSDYRTPNIDRLAKQGMLFTDAYAAAPVCSPTRAAAMTGLSPARLQITNHIPDRWRFYDGHKIGPGKSVNQLEPKYETIAERLKAHGYGTGFIGKWHLAGANQGELQEEYLPENHGFDINIAGCAQGGPGGEQSFFDPYTIPTITNRKEGEYLPNRLADEAIQYMKSQKKSKKPFFLCLWNYTVHWPVEAPDSLYKKYSPDGKPNLHQKYQAMIEGMDQAVGKVLKALDDMELTKETFVVFTSDNGPFVGDNAEMTSAAPLKDSKGYLSEGGIRVPLIIRWPGKIKAGTISKEPVITMDFVPTFLDLAKKEYKSGEFDGESLLPLLTKNSELKRKAIYFHYPHYAFHQENKMGSVIRKGDYKLIQHYSGEEIALYNLRSDIGEKTNIATAEPAKTKELLGDLNQWLLENNAQMPRQMSDIPNEELFGKRNDTE